jgi:hypothetical protein
LDCELQKWQAQAYFIFMASSIRCCQTFLLGLTYTDDQAIGLNISAIRSNILRVYLIYVLIALPEFPSLLGERKYDEWMFVAQVALI